jgi:hypothetical protein
MNRHPSLSPAGGWRLLVPVLAVVLLLLSPTRAQTYERKGHLLLGVNLGYGTAQLQLPDDPSDRHGGLGWNFRFGFFPNDRIALAIEGTLWTSQLEDDYWLLNFTGGSLTWFAWRGFYVRGGLGIGIANADFAAGPNYRSATDGGLAATAALGYEFRLSRTVGLGPQVDFNWIGLGDDVHANYLNITAAASFYL